MSTSIEITYQSGDIDEIKQLIQKSSNIYAKDSNNDGTLRLASNTTCIFAKSTFGAENGHTEIVKYLVEKEANVHTY